MTWARRADYAVMAKQYHGRGWTMGSVSARSPSVSGAGLELQAKNEPKTILDILEERASYAASEFKQKFTIDGDDLRHIRHRVFSQARRLGGNQDVSGSIDQAKVRAEHHGNDGVQTTPVEGVALDDQDRPVVPGLGTLGFTEIRRPDLAAFDYHGSRTSERPCSRLTARGSRLSSDA